MMSRQPFSPPVDPPDQNPHFVRAVTEMSDEQDIIADEDIYASNGIKLLAKGVQINRHHFDLLTRHRLQIPLDRSLSLSAPVSLDHMALEAAQLLEHDHPLAQMATSAGDLLAVKHDLLHLSLPPALCFRLSVMRSQREPLYRHSLRVALLAHSIGLRLELSEHDRSQLLLAALCHDIGEMHTDPALLAPGRVLNQEERRFIYVHPVTGFVLLQQLCPADCCASALAVLHHHERADGSGYPHGLIGDQIHPLGRIVGLAEVAEGMLRRQDLDRLDVLLKLNKPRFAPGVIGALRELLRAVPNRSHDGALPRSELVKNLSRLSAVLQSWGILGGQLERREAAREGGVLPLGFLFERMDTLRSLVLQTGCDPDDMTMVLALVEGDEGAVRELVSFTEELAWLMSDLANEIERRTPSLDPATRTALSGLVGALSAA